MGRESSRFRKKIVPLAIITHSLRGAAKFCTIHIGIYQASERIHKRHENIPPRAIIRIHHRVSHHLNRCRVWQRNTYSGNSASQPDADAKINAAPHGWNVGAARLLGAALPGSRHATRGQHGNWNIVGLVLE